ncbi:MAG TPA: toll/interleukin-1 receptor domain-containing protein [Bryobacteraceae bacterium]|nr:toll/interleukin-1 receptor domain-containing protein [Bryobacteraceae bacterium]
MDEVTSATQLAQIVLRRLAKGKAVEVDGLGVFYPDAELGVRFEPRSAQIFLAYVKEDQAAVERLYDTLEAEGFSPWMDARKLLPGQNWPRAIETAIETSDFFVACFSNNSVNKKGGFPAEIRYALDCARHMPLDDIFIIPLRLDACRVPRSIQKELQYIDLFPAWECGLKRLISMIRSRRQAA